MSVDTHSWRHLPRRSSKNCDLPFANCDRQTDIFKDNYSIDTGIQVCMGFFLRKSLT